MEVKKRILERFTELPPRMQAAARFVIDHPNEVLILSMRAIAQHAGIQPATFVRLAQELGFSGWPELKSACAADMGLRQEAYGQRAKNLAARGRDPGLLGELFAAQRENIVATEGHNAAALPLAADLLKHARSVHAAGFRASFPVAYALVYGYRLFRNSVALIDGQGGSLEMQLRLIAAGDVVVVIGFAPYSREAMTAAATARAAGARLLAMTDSAASPLALAADAVLLFSTDSPSFFPSIAAAVALAEALLERLVVDAGKRGAQRLDAAENQLFESGAYLQRPQKRLNPSKARNTFS